MCIAKIRALFYFFWSWVVSSALFFPSHLGAAGGSLEEFGDLVAALRVLKAASDFPAALIATSLAAIIFGFGLSLVAVASRDIYKLIKRLHSLRGRFGCLGMSSVVIAFPIMLIFVELRPRAGSVAELIFSAMSESRMMLAVWCSSLFMIFFYTFTAFFSSAIGLFVNWGANEWR